MSDRVGTWLSAAAAVAALGVLPCAGAAQTFGLDDRRPFESRQNFAWDVRLGPYVSRIDTELSGATPYQDIFGAPPNYNTPNPRIMLYTSFDWQAVRLGPVCSLGPGLSLGITNVVEKAPTQSSMAGGAPSTWARSSEDTALLVVPATLHATVRFDGLARRVPWLPLVPYARAGLAYGLWWISNGTGLARAGGTQDAFGGSLGWHVSLGLAVLLDAFDRRLARSWDQTQGINHSYVVLEYGFTDLAGFGRPQLNIGNFNWSLGMAFEF